MRLVGPRIHYKRGKGIADGALASFLRNWFTTFPLGQSLNEAKMSIQRHNKILEETLPRQDVTSTAREAVSTVTMFRNYQFTGRDKMLQTLHERFWPYTSSQEYLRSGSQLNFAPPHLHFSEGSVGPICCVLRGLGGIGKTQCALEYYFRYRNFYDAVFWLPSEQEGELKKAYGLIANKVAFLENSSSKAQVTSNLLHHSPPEEIARRWLEETSKLHLCAQFEGG